MMLVTLAQAFRQLRIAMDDGETPATHPEKDDVEFRAKLATGIVMDYIKDRENKNEWTDLTCPAPVQASILIVLSDLEEHRAGSAADDVFISEAVRRLLARWRDPALA